MSLTNIIARGPLAYQHHYMQTATSEETCAHTLPPPAALVTAAKRYPDAQIVTYGDGTLGIEINGRLWAAQMPHAQHRPAKSLPQQAWQYITLAIGGDGDTYAS